MSPAHAREEESIWLVSRSFGFGQCFLLTFQQGKVRRAFLEEEDRNRICGNEDDCMEEDRA